MILTNKKNINFIKKIDNWILKNKYINNDYTLMGIPVLFKIIEENAPEAVTYKDIEQYRGKVIAIDAYQTIHRIIRNLVKDGKLMKNAVIHAVWFKHVSFVKYGIKAIWVFDGKPPSEKEEVLKKRREVKEKAEEALEKKELSDEERDRMVKRTIGITVDDIKDIKRLLELAKVPFVMSRSEADSQCAAFTEEPHNAYGVATEDSDVLAFGAKKMLKAFTNHTKKGKDGKKKKIIEIDLEKTIEGLGFQNYYQFVQFCVLLGCDYCNSRISVSVRHSKEYNEPRSWAEQARKRLIEHKNIEGVVQSCITSNEKAIIDKDGVPNIYFEIPEGYLEKAMRAYELIIRAEVYDPEDLDLKWKEGDIEGLKNFLIKEKEFNVDKLTKSIESTIEYFNEKKGGNNYTFRGYRRSWNKRLEIPDDKWGSIRDKDYRNEPKIIGVRKTPTLNIALRSQKRRSRIMKSKLVN